MTKQPELPNPAHHTTDSMLSRKFGKEVANYFSGSPLNRVTFLRHDHGFISSALIHPSTSFLLMNDLAPMAKDPSQLAYASRKEIVPLIGENPFEKTEEQMIREYRSDVTLPLVLFLGLDERRKDGFEHGIYKGSPYFAVDITPKGTIMKQAEGIIEAMKAKGLTFLEGRTAMSLNAPEGMSGSLEDESRGSANECRSRDLCSSPRSSRLERP
jgi:NAD+ diphosphatase